MNVFYEQVSHETIQYVQYLTGRRQEINFWEVFVWKRKAAEDPDKEIQTISEILKEEISKNEIKEKGKKKGMDIYETEDSVKQYLDFHYGEN